MRRLSLVACLVTLVAACGGSATPEEAALAPTRECLAGAGVPVTQENLDFVASTALGGALRASPGTRTVTIAFAETPEQAADIEQAYRQFAGSNIPIDDVLRRDGNVVMVWDVPPGPDEARLVEDCLQG